MSGHLPATHPAEPPEWLDRWLPAEVAKSMFKEPVRRYSYKLLVQERSRVLRWLGNGFTLDIGSQRVTWRLVDDAWRPSCTCGYVNDRCPHAYAAACVLAEVTKAEGWRGPPRRAPSPERARRSRESRPQPTQPAVSQARSNLPRSSTSSLAKPTIEVEADFHHQEGQVAIRFYMVQGESRSLLRLQSVFNYAVRVRTGGGLKWAHRDWSFLKWLEPQLRGKVEVRQNLQVFKVPKARFDLWLERWDDTPGRFVDRASGAELSTRGVEPAHLVVELRDAGDEVGIAPVVVTPRGARHEFRELFGALIGGRGQTVVDGQLLSFTPPLSWNLLRECFAKKVPSMDRKLVVEHLGTVLEGRLDILEGDLIEREGGAKGRLRLEAVPEGAEVVLRATVDGVPLAADGRYPAVLRSRGRNYVVKVYDGQCVRDIRKLFRDVEGEDMGEGRVRVTGAPSRIAKLAELWRQLSEDVQRDVVPELAGLLGDGRELQPDLTLHEEGNFVNLRVGWLCGDVRFSDSELRDALREGNNVLRTRDGQWLSIDPARAQALAAEIAAEGFEGDQMRLFRPEAHRAAERIQANLAACLEPSCTHLAERLREEADAPQLEVPPELRDVLRPYQLAGFSFLANRASYGVGAILADDMGLGKTVQALALLRALSLRARSERRAFRSLVVCPASVVGVWMEQVEQFCPELRCSAYAGAAARRRSMLEGEWDLLVTNYSLARMDVEELRAIDYDVVCLDEAQHIKNPESQVAQAVKSLRTSQTLALTGTPLENRLLDLWSIMDFVNPGFLGGRGQFESTFEADGRRDRLARRIAPVLLRRTKDLVAPELPARTEEVLHIELSEEERRLYDLEVVRARQSLREKGPIEVLAALTRLRQLACHPALLGRGRPEEGSSKSRVLVEMLEELLDEGHSALVFSQFTSMLDLLRTELEEAGLPSMMLTGKTPTAKRPALVREFNESEEPRVFLLSLRAAGTGLTLTRADYVFLFDPWWNPAVERQAIDRTHRIGQDKPVFAYRLVAAETVEEKVLALQREKAEMFAEVMQDAETTGVPSHLSFDDIRSLI